MPRRKNVSRDNLIALARKYKDIHPDFLKYSKRKKLGAADKKKIKRLYNQYTALNEEYGAGGFRILRSKKAIKEADKAGLRIKQFNLIRLNNYANDDAPIEIYNNGKLVIQHAIHRHNTHLRKWYFHKVDTKFSIRKAQSKDTQTQVLIAFGEALADLQPLMKKTRQKEFTFYLWGSKGVMYKHSVSTPGLLIEYLAEWLQRYVPRIEKQTTRGTMLEEVVVGFAWHTNLLRPPKKKKGAQRGKKNKTNRRI